MRRFLCCCPLSGDSGIGDRQIGGYSASRPGSESRKARQSSCPELSLMDGCGSHSTMLAHSHSKRRGRVWGQ